ncbi:MAG: hypothetical protein HOP29_00900 [Phycisphaerales bacterium]|nr:hypothetical protein [Phycisphaerales bacterium]
MIQFCIFGGHEGQLNTEKKIYVTIFGGCELKKQTLARRIVESRRRPSNGEPSRRRFFFVTIFGGTEVKLPTLAEEYLDMQDAMRAGLITPADWEAAQLLDEDVNYGSFTAFGGFEASHLPSEDEEVEGLAINRHLGHIPENAGHMLEHAVGRSGSHRTAILRQALQRGASPVHA